MNMRPLSDVEARVLGTLMEKARTVPDSYPLSLNAVVLGCNQKTSREPVMTLSESQVQEALDSLRALSLVFETSGSRVARHEHNLQRALGVPEQSAVLLGLLMLRGPQTAGELRINAERWYRFADISSVEAFLDELAARTPEKGGALVVRLPRVPGEREQRWMHLLCGAPPEQAPSHADPRADPRARAIPTGAADDNQALGERVAHLETEVAQLRQWVQNLRAELGLSQPGH